MHEGKSVFEQAIRVDIHGELGRTLMWLSENIETMGKYARTPGNKGTKGKR
jgi:hypothetical protein